MSADGKTIAICAIFNDGNGTSSGHVRVYTINLASGNWMQVGMDIDGKAEDDRSGVVAISADGKKLANCAPLNDGNGTYSGHVRFILRLAIGHRSDWILLV
jgi:hypothetical protein